MNFESPINGVSFGNVSMGLLREAYRRNMDVNLFVIGGQKGVQLNSYSEEQGFLNYLQSCGSNPYSKFDKSDLSFKLWHLNGCLPCFGQNQRLLTFFELDQLTETEVNIANQNDIVFVTSEYTKKVFEDSGVKSKIEYLPLFLDSKYYKKVNVPKIEDRITFNLLGKAEHRKNHKKIIQAWIKKFGNNKKYSLQCSINNPFFSPEDNMRVRADFTGGEQPFNVIFNNGVVENSLYNKFLNSADIVIAGSGGEGWGLPEFQSVAVGAHAVVMNAHGYKSWATNENSVLFEPSGKKSAIDNIFFRKGDIFNQGNIFDFNEDDFISACEEAVKRSESNPVNEEGLKLKDQFNVEKTFDQITKI